MNPFIYKIVWVKLVLNPTKKEQTEQNEPNNFKPNTNLFGLSNLTFCFRTSTVHTWPKHVLSKLVILYMLGSDVFPRPLNFHSFLKQRQKNPTFSNSSSHKLSTLLLKFQRHENRCSCCQNQTNLFYQ